MLITGGKNHIWIQNFDGGERVDVIYRFSKKCSIKLLLIRLNRPIIKYLMAVAALKMLWGSICCKCCSHTWERLCKERLVVIQNKKTRMRNCKNFQVLSSVPHNIIWVVFIHIILVKTRSDYCRFERYLF